MAKKGKIFVTEIPVNFPERGDEGKGDDCQDGPGATVQSMTWLARLRGVRRDGLGDAAVVVVLKPLEP